jgi:hypothetical protein
MAVEIEAAIIGVSGALLVWLTSWLWSLYVDHRTGKRVRAMLALEIQDNLDTLQNFLKRVGQHVTFTESPLGNLQRNDAMQKENLPTGSHRIWRGAIQFIPVALTVEEIKRVHSFHKELDQLTETKRDPSSKAADLESRITRLLGDGNPLEGR